MYVALHLISAFQFTRTMHYYYSLQTSTNAGFLGKCHVHQMADVPIHMAPILARAGLVTPVMTVKLVRAHKCTQNHT